MDVRSFVILATLFMSVCSNEDLELRLKLLELKDQVQSQEMRLLTWQLQEVKETLHVLGETVDDIPMDINKHEESKETRWDHLNDGRVNELLHVLINSFKDEKALRIKLESDFKEKCQHDDQDIIEYINEAIDTLDRRLKDERAEYTSLHVATQHKLTGLQDSLHDIAEQLSNNVKTTNKMSEQLKNMKSINNKQQQNIETYQTQQETLGHELKKLQDSVISLEVMRSQQVAFSAKVSPSYKDLDPWQTLAFRSIITNIGNGLAAETGVFTAPIAGIYVFHSHIMGGQTSMEMCLRVNGQIRMMMYTSPGSSYGLDSNMLVIKLQKEDKVEVVKHGKYGARPFYVHHAWSTFSGFLLFTTD